MNREKINFGKEGEEIAAEYLKKKGYKIIERNYRSRLGEIDIVALHKAVTVFVEVKARSGSTFGLPEDAVDKNKQRQMIRVALGYIKHRRLPEGRFRFDVVGVSFCEGRPAVKLITDAFQVENG